MSNREGNFSHCILRVLASNVPSSNSLVASVRAVLPTFNRYVPFKTFKHTQRCSGYCTFYPISFHHHIHPFMIIVNSPSFIASLFKSTNFPQKVSYSSLFLYMGMEKTLIKVFILEMAIYGLAFCILF